MTILRIGAVTLGKIQKLSKDNETAKTSRNQIRFIYLFFFF